jgi:putative transposase
MNTNASVYLYVHIIWTVQRRESLLTKPLRKVLFTHIKTAADQLFLKIIKLDGVEDHVHCLLQLHPTQSLSQCVKTLKEISSAWINETKLLKEPFDWDEGYAAYSVSPSALKQVADYVQNQESHHKAKTLDSELEAFEKFRTDQTVL